jgi:cytochrome o ubiquinol oxidase subunit 2
VPLLGMLLLGGCNMTLLDPTGQVGLEQRNLIITATLLMLLVVVPVIVMTFLFAWKYRASNKDATYTRNGRTPPRSKSRCGLFRS